MSIYRLIMHFAKQALSSNRVVRTSPIALEQGDRDIATPSDPTPLRVTAFRPITYFKLLNQWYGAELGIQEFRVLHNIRKNVLWQNRDWFKDIMVVDEDWEGDIEGITVRVIPSPNPQFNNELEDIRTC
ncbi:hypothetical protein D8674_020619 [Pyrus ussuriensis x Pyrus communis]|uniref:Uncharacterized protein n=1 Tax=Pyrus ussuriensis x Pyrus communis TaxID=2448454 RepID=A0A5N5HLA5_9ROSA|nr:hypothetical protein D8674_020619 [Pyrus ussuriensis x Pyrus communis]